MKLRLPKIISQKNIDESLESRDVKNEMKRRKQVRKQIKKVFDLDNLKASQFPKTYRASYFEND
jgi:hypothetical protein